MQCFEIGVEAAGLINTDPAVHYAKFQNFIRGEEPRDDLFLGVQPVHIMANPEVIHSHEANARHTQPPDFSSEGLRHIPGLIGKFTGSATHSCLLCTNAYANTCKTVHAWWYSLFDNDNQDDNSNLNNNDTNNNDNDNFQHNLKPPWHISL